MSKRRQVPKRGFKPPKAALNPRKLLQELSELQQTQQREQQALVTRLRDEGATWKEIANLTGMNSAQAARYRFTPKGPPPTP